MSDTVEVKKDIDVSCECEECSAELEISCTANNFGDISCSVSICECATKDDEG